MLDNHCLVLVSSAEREQMTCITMNPRKNNPLHFPWHQPPAVLRQQMDNLVCVQLHFSVIQIVGGQNSFIWFKILNVYCSPLRTKFRLITCGNMSKTVNNFWFLYLCATRFLQPLASEPIDSEIITEAPLKNCHLEVKNFRETPDLANYRE